MKLGVLMAAMFAAMVLIQAPQASAKGIDHAHFAGPGLRAGGVTIIRGDLQETGLLKMKNNSLVSLGISRRELGPAYRANYRMDYAPRATLHQVVYPYAQGGPITFTPRDQHIGQDYESFSGGWYAARPGLLAYLIARGFPRFDPTDHVKPPSSAVGASQTTSTPSGGGTWMMGAAALTVLGAVALLVRRRELSEG
jgi:MYXO-CTERM domain-containing protein